MKCYYAVEIVAFVFLLVLVAGTIVTVSALNARINQVEKDQVGMVQSTQGIIEILKVVTHTQRSEP